MSFSNFSPLPAIILIVIFTFSLPAASPITICATGDLMLGSWTQDVIRDSGYAHPFKHIDSIFQDADIVFSNLEAPFGETGEVFPQKTYTFQVRPDLVNVLTAGKINLVSLANNHIMDFGVESLVETMDLLKEHNISFAGAGLNITQARKPALLEINGERVAFLSYSLTFPEEFWATDSSAGTCFPSHNFVYEDIKKLKDGNDLVIISCHWSSELLDRPKPYQIELAHKMINAGADIILGHHPHVVQGVEYYKNRVIAYSLGNFIFGSYSKTATVSMILKINWSEGRINTCKIIPINVYNEIVEFQPRPLLGKEKTDFLENLNKLSLELNDYPIVISSDGKVI